MFPYAMLATTTIFYSNDWPKRLLLRFNLFKKEKFSTEDKKFVIAKLSNHCIYDKEKSNDDKNNKTKKGESVSLYHKIFTWFTILYVGEQLVLPYSHFITKGYNNWTNGLYGYSWDMMVHSWHTQHIKIHFIDKKTKKTHYLDPKAWTSKRRWSSHGDMIYQYAQCIKHKLHAYNYTDIELYMDVWRSMNHRFNQRQLDPRVDLLKAEWSPWKTTPWLMPLMTDLSPWRSKLKEIEEKYKKLNSFYDLTFVADFNGLSLENYVSQHLNTSIEVLSGKVNVELIDNKKKNYTLTPGRKLQVLILQFHA
jgi:vitamin K-dependent gamma-carboxylase